MPQASAHVTTFYSFKGGVGRSLLLANVGWHLAERRHVLLWDLDIEAPGLHRIPALRPPKVDRGFFEWLAEWAESSGKNPKDPLTKKDKASLQRLVLPVPGRPNLSILPAFGDSADFARLYSEGPWRLLFVEEPELGLGLIDAVLASLGEGREYILIDSRTGITDIGGFLTALLPHVTVLVSGYGHQSLNGLLHVKKALEPAAAGRLIPRQRLGAGAELGLAYVISPVPDDVEESAERRRVVKEVLGDVSPIEIPFDRRLLWSEQLLSATDPGSATAKAYAQVAERLTSFRNELLSNSEALSSTDARYPESSDSRLIDESGRLRMRQGLSFEARVRRLLELHGYTVEAKQIRGAHEVDLVARITGGLDEQCWWVECKDHKRPVGKDVLEKLAAWIAGKEAAQQSARGMVVARSFTAAAVTFAADHPDLRAWTIDDLERRLFDPRPYLHALVSNFEQGPLGRVYVNQRVLLEGKPAEEADADLLDHALAWAGGRGPRLWLLLGDYGTGKSAFFQRFAYELARHALEDPEAPFPLAVDLKEYPNATSAETLLFEHLRRKAPSFRGDPAALLHLLAAGRCVLLLDAFDEMGLAAAGRSVEDQFRELARLAGDEPLDPHGNRLLVTCRTHFFRDQQQVKDTATGLLGGLVAAEDSSLGRLARRFNAEIDELRLFNDDQIGEFLLKHLGEKDAAKARKFIQDTYDLPTLAPRPVLLDLIVKSLPTLWAEGATHVTPAGLYEVYTRQWLEDRSGRNLQTPPALRHRLLALLASTLWRRDDRQIHHRDLLAEVQSLAGQFPGIDWDRVDVELRTAAFLVRSPDGYYRFSHKSFLEYFLARRLWDALAVSEGADALDLPPLSPEVGEFFRQIPEEGLIKRVETLRQILQAPYRSGLSENALRLGIWSEEGEGRRFEVTEAQLAGARLESENLLGLRLPGADLRGALLARTRLAETVLDRANLAGADLTLAALSDASLREANLDGAIIRSATCDRTDFSDSSLVGVDLTAASGDSTTFDRTELSEAKLGSSVWTNTNFRDAHLECADTTGWLLAAERNLPPGCAGGHIAGLESRVTFRVGNRNSVQSVAWSPDGRQLATGSHDGVVCLWDTATGEKARELTGLRRSVVMVAWSLDGSQLAIASRTGDVRLWDAVSWETIRSLDGSRSVKSVAWSRDGRRLALLTDEGIVRVLDAASGQMVRELPGSRDSVLSWSPDGRHLATGPESDDGNVRLWNAASGQMVRELSGSDHRAWSLEWSPDGSRLVSGGVDGRVCIWDASSGQMVRELTGPHMLIWSLAWSPDGLQLASGTYEGRVRLWDVASGKIVRELSGSRSIIWSVEWSADGRQLATGSDDGNVRLWDTASGESVRELTGSRGTGLSLAWSPDGRELATGGHDGDVCLWDAASGERVREMTGSGGSVWSVAWSPAGQQLATGSDNGTVRLWDAASGESVRELTGLRGSVFSVGWSPDGHQLAASDQANLRLWDAASGESVRELTGSGDIVLYLAWSPDGQKLATRHTNGGMRLWDAVGGANVREMTGSRESISSVAWSPDGRQLVTGSSNGAVCLWDAASGDKVREIVGLRDGISSVAWSPDGRQFVTGSSDGTLCLWDVTTGERVREMTGLGGRVSSVAWSPDGQLLATESSNGNVHLWDVTGGLRGTFTASGDLALATVPGGWFVHSPRSSPLDPLRLRLLVARPGLTPDRGWSVLPLGGLAQWFESPERVRASLAGQPQPPVTLPGAVD